MPTTVVNKRAHKYDVYIGRGSKWGNPFKIGQDGSREDVIEKHNIWLMGPEQQHLRISIIKGELRNKKLGCFCKPKMCHGDLLARISNSYHKDL